MQAYSDKRRESDPHALPDVEVWYSDGLADDDVTVVALSTCEECRSHVTEIANVSTDATYCLPCARELFPAGWFWWGCSPGCLPDSEPYGPFESEEAALADAREGLEYDDEEE